MNELNNQSTVEKQLDDQTEIHDTEIFSLSYFCKCCSPCFQVK
jgi:hypothetical protein